MHKPGSGASVGERSNFKNFLPTREIMVMNSNDRGEYCLHTLVDRKRKRYDNVVDVVIVFTIDRSWYRKYDTSAIRTRSAW